MRERLTAGLAFVVSVMILSCSGTSPSRSSSLVNDAATVSPSGQNTTPAANSSPHPARVLQFSSYDWIVKSSDRRVGPGPNYFADSDGNVFVDTQGRLHLRLTQRDGRWYCAEVISAQSFGYGTYRFYLDSTIDNLDTQVVLGMFTWK